MEKIILNNSTEAVKISCKNENISVGNIDPLNTQVKKKKKTNKNKTLNKKSNKKYVGLKDLLDDINKNKNITKKVIITDNNLNEKNDISEIKNSENLEICNETKDASESDFNEFSKKITSKENEQINDNDKIKTNFSICDYYNGYDKYLSGSEISTINLSNSLNYIKKEKFIENFSEENNNLDINEKEDFVNNNLIINKNDSFVNTSLQDNINNNFYDCKFEFQENSKFLKNNECKKEKELGPYYSKFDFYNNDYNMTYRLNFNENHRGRRRLWICKYCGNDNYHFRDFCHVCNNPKF